MEPEDSGSIPQNEERQMAHEIDMSNDRANMAYVGAAPWHGLGNRLQPGAPLREWQIAAGLDWTAERTSLYYQPTDSAPPTRLKGRSLLFRSDTQAPLGILTDDRYKVVQPGAVLEFFREFLEVGSLEMETAGSLAGGKRIWALAKTGDEMDLGGDRLCGYLLLATSMDGSLATTARFTSVRVVCQNTLSMADRQTQGACVRVPHSRSFNEKQVKAQLGLSHAIWEDFAGNVERLVNTRVSAGDVQAWLQGLFARPGEEAAVQPQKLAVKRVFEAVAASPGAKLPSAAGTAWGALNGLTYYVDHQRGRSSDTRLNSAWFGYGATLKQRALDSALEMFC